MGVGEGNIDPLPDRRLQVHIMDLPVNKKVTRQVWRNRVQWPC